MNSPNRSLPKQLLPADLDAILEKYGHLLHAYKNLSDKNSIYANYKRTTNKLSVLLPLKEHPVHGATGLHATEKYKNGFVKEYHYQWKIIIPKQGILLSHISAWENESHSDSNTPEEFNVNSEPHHHHHVPGNRRERKDNFEIHTLDAAFAFVARYIESGEEYKP